MRIVLLGNRPVLFICLCFATCLVRSFFDSRIRILEQQGTPPDDGRIHTKTKFWLKSKSSSLSSLRGDVVLARTNHNNINRSNPPINRTTPPQTKQNHDESTRTTLRNLNYLNFGTSVSWGAGMKDRFHAYPYLLSPDSKNLALRATGPSYSSVCLQSMIAEKERDEKGLDSSKEEEEEEEEDEYDVIILEYLQRSSEGLFELAWRLKQRYPNAIIIFLRMRGPTMVVRTLPSGQIQTLKEWCAEEGFDLHSLEFETHFTQQDQHSWYFTDLSEAIQFQNEAIQAVGGYLYELPIPTDPVEAFSSEKYRNWFSHDWQHMSELGHRQIAHGIQTLIETQIVSALSSSSLQPPSSLSSKTLPLSFRNTRKLHKKNRVSTASLKHNKNGGGNDIWEDSGAGSDRCATWFLTGDCPHEYSEDLKLRVFDTRNGKQALELPPYEKHHDSNDNDDDVDNDDIMDYTNSITSSPWTNTSSISTILVDNPYPYEMGLYLSFMTTGPAPSLYPKTQVSINHSLHDDDDENHDDPKHTKTTVIDPTSRHMGEYKVHVVKTELVGILQSGINTVYIKPLQRTELPFRIVGTGIAPFDMVHSIQDLS